MRPVTMLLLLLACGQPAPDEVPDDVEDTDPAVDTDDPGVEDTDCEPTIWYADPDGDGWGSGPEVPACDAPPGHVAIAGDCDEARPEVHPEAADADCDRLDADCDGIGAGDVWFVAVNGAFEDLDFDGTPGAPTAWEADGNGVITFCPGTWYATIEVTAYDVTLRGFDAATTVIAAEGAGSAVEVSLDSYVVVEGLTLTGGAAERGGGLAIAGTFANVALRDAIVEGNTASGSGGGVFVGAGSLAVERAQIRDNTAASGGGIAGDGAWVVTDSRIEGNAAIDGGGLSAGATRPTVIRTAIVGNTATGEGGGLWVGAGGAILEDAAVTGNAAAEGGGLFVVGLADVACLAGGGVLQNTAAAGGGAWVTPTGTLYSTVCDWGTGATGNDPSDVHLEAGDVVITDLGAAASFRCDGDTARCEPR